MPDLEQLLRTEATSFVLELTRVVALLAVAPLPWGAVPVRFRAGLAVMLAAASHGLTAAPAELVGSPIATAGAVSGELILGAAMGFVLRLSVAVAEVAAAAMDPLIGLGAAQLFDPTSRSQQSGVSIFYRNLTLYLMLVVGVHRELISALIGSFRAIPPGAIVDASGTVQGLLALSVNALHSGVRIAMPIIAVLVVIQVGLAFVSRAAPQMQIFSVGFAVTLTVSAVVVSVGLPDFTQALLGELTATSAQLEQLLVAVVVRRPP